MERVSLVSPNWCISLMRTYNGASIGSKEVALAGGAGWPHCTKRADAKIRALREARRIAKFLIKATFLLRQEVG